MAVRPSWLLASDLDGTVIPLDRAPERAEEIRAFTRAVDGNPALALAYVTGRSLQLATLGVEEFALPPADFLAVDVGTRVFRRTPEGYAPDLAYDERMTEAVGGVELAKVSGVLDDISELQIQPAWGQGRFKRSYFVDPSVPEAELVERARELIEAEGGRVALVTSHDPVRDVGLLDILPHGVAKDVAVRHLREITGVARDQVVYAGDSGNDMAAFLAGFAGIVVGNAPEALKERLRRAHADGGDSTRLFFAEAPFSGGVLEGLRHYGVA
jgi:hydroxymethylpyrimidine pyrophosphatase-like HAD family hydrolase